MRPAMIKVKPVAFLPGRQVPQGPIYRRFLLICFTDPGKRKSDAFCRAASIERFGGWRTWLSSLRITGGFSTREKKSRFP
jgi:hypothetical protein